MQQQPLDHAPREIGAHIDVNVDLAAVLKSPQAEQRAGDRLVREF